MSGVGVIDIHDAMKNGEHCRICFRTASVRKLVSPVFLTQFQDAMKIANNLKPGNTGDLTVCCLCEALAAKAVRFLWAVQLAAIIEQLCSHMDLTKKREAVLAHLNRTSESPSAIFCLQAEAIENSLYRLPEGLTRTDTLIVGSDVSCFSVQASQVSIPAPTPEPTYSTQPDYQFTRNRVNIIPNHPPKPVQTYPGKRIQTHTNTAQVIKRTPVPEVAPRVIQNLYPITKVTHTTQTDHQPTRNAIFNYIPTQNSHNPKLIETYQSQHVPTYNTNVPYLPQAALRVLQTLGDVVVLADNFAYSCRALALRTRTQDTTGKDEFALHFIVFFAGNTYVPFLKLKISTDGMIKSVTDQDLHKFVNPPPPQKSAKKRNQSPASTQTHTHGNTAPGSIREATVIKAMWNKNSVAPKKQRVESPVVLNPLVSSYGLLNIYDKTVKEVILVVDEPNVNNVNVNVGPSANDAKTTDTTQMVKNKQPIPSTHRVDWEDKIPMDVISFMDATDPNPSERIMQPNPPRQTMGEISDIRTVIDSDVQIIENIECIDLS